MASLRFGQGCSTAEALHPSQGEISTDARRTSPTCGSCVWYMASWNMKTLVDIKGSFETARSRSDVSVVDERKIDQVVSELNK